MDKYEALLQLLLNAAKEIANSSSSHNSDGDIPVGVSNRHIHLSQEDMENIFGKGYQLTPTKDLSQPGYNVEFTLPSGVEIVVENPIKIVVKGICWK